MIQRIFGRSTITHGLSGVVSTAVIGAAMLVSAPTLAQDSEAALEEIMVTATRRAGGTDIQSTPVAVSALTEADFTELFAQDIGGVARLVPNFSAAQITGFNAAGFAIRGAGQTDILVYWEPPVGMLVDDFVVPHMQTQLLEPYDIEQVEVLRGPQGTLFGKNTTAGVVNVRTKRPHMDGFDLEASICAGNYGRLEGRAAINIPAGDNLAFRVNAITQQSDGYYKNGKTSLGVGGALGPAGDYIGDGRDLGGDDVVSGRAKMLWTPTDNLDIFLQYEFLRDRGDTPPAINETENPEQLFPNFGMPGIGPGDGDPLDFAGVSFRDTLSNGESSGLNMAGGHQIDVNGFYMNVDWRLNNFDFVSVTGFRDQESRLPSNYTGEVGTTVDPGPGGNPVFSVFDATRDDNRETFQQEFRLASNFDGNFNFVTGLFYQSDETSFNVVQYLGIFELFGVDGPDENPIVITNNQEMESIAVFVDGSFDFADTWTLAGGIRYTQEEKDFFSRPSTPFFLYGQSPSDWPFDPNNTAQFPCDATNPCQEDSETWDEPTYRLVLSNQFTDDMYAYASYAHGFKSGGYSDQAGSALDVPLEVTRYDPETADSFEIGFKWDFWDDKARLNAAIFHVEYEDMQRAAIVTNTATAAQETVVFNAAKVPATGLELEAFFVFNDNWSARFNLGYLDAEYDEFLLDLDLDGVCDPTSDPLCQDLSGRPVTRAPELQWGADLTYDTEIFNGNLRAQVGVYYQDENTFYYAAPSFEVDQSPEFMSQWDTEIEEYMLWNAFATYTHESGNWWVSIFGKNLSDERYHSAAQYVGGLWTFSNYAPPRTYGMEVGISL